MPYVLSEQEQKTYSTMEELLEHNLERLKRGTLDLSWMNPRYPERWGVRIKPSAHGLTMMDLSRNKEYGTIPTRATTKGFVPRGAFIHPEEEKLLPDMGYDVLDKFHLYSDNVMALYEEAKSRQWNAATAIPWEKLKPLPEDLEKAVCQNCTLLTQVEFVAGDFPSKWVWRIPNDFFEVKAFLSTQMMDEARHTEVFRKRALANGGGLLKAGVGVEWALKAILDAPDHSFGTFILNVIGEGMILTLFRAGEYLAHTSVDQEIFRRCMQDEARHVSYGTMELKFFLDNAPDREQALEEMHSFADFAERAILGAVVEPTTVEPLMILFAGSVKKIDQGMDSVKMFWSALVGEYLQRCERAGFSRRDRCKIPLDLPVA